MLKDIEFLSPLQTKRSKYQTESRASETPDGHTCDNIKRIFFDSVLNSVPSLAFFTSCFWNNFNLYVNYHIFWFNSIRKKKLLVAVVLDPCC